MTSSQYGICIILFQSLSGKSCDSRSRSILLQTSGFSTSAVLCLFIVHTQVSDLSTCSVCSNQRTSIYDHASSNTGSKCDHDHVFPAFSCSQPHFSQGSNIGIIAGFYRKTCQFFHLSLYLFISPAKVRRILNNSLCIYRCRNSNPDSGHFLYSQSFFFHLSFQRFRDIRKNRFSFILCTGLDLPFFQKFSFCCKESDFNCCSSDVHSKAILHFPFSSLYFLVRFC